MLYAPDHHIPEIDGGSTIGAAEIGTEAAGIGTAGVGIGTIKAEVVTEIGRGRVIDDEIGPTTAGTGKDSERTATSATFDDRSAISAARLTRSASWRLPRRMRPKFSKAVAISWAWTMTSWWP